MQKQCSRAQVRVSHDAAVRAGDARAVLIADLPPQAQVALLHDVLEDDAPVEWSEEDVVFLHWRLLKALNALSQPATPLEEKIDTLRWVFTEPERDARPFSFITCLQVVGCSRLSPTPYFGVLDADFIRSWIRHHMRAWLDDTITRYPAWVKEAILRHPSWVESRLAKNPQWINEEIKRRASQGDLFA